MWEAQAVLVIAANTGWSEEFIRWELPKWRANAYFHTARVMAGERFRWPGEPTKTSRWFGAVKKWVRKKFQV